MPKTVALPDGNTATLRDPKSLSERKRRPLQNLSAQLASLPGFAEAASTDDPMKAMVGISSNMGGVLALVSDITDATIIAYVESWSYPAEVTIDAVLDLPGDVYDVLAKETQAASKVTEPNFEPSADPESPTGPAQP